jgi:chromosome partitioning protein
VDVIVIANHKGGVGKTTTAVNLAGGMTGAGQRTLLVDADAQAHATYYFADVAAVQADLQDVIADHVPADKVIVATRLEGLDLLPATLNLAVLDMQMVAMTRKEDLVRRALAPLSDRYDHVIIDLPPNLAPLTLACLVAADHIVVPVNASRLALQGMATFLGWTQEYRRQEVISGQVLGILLTMYTARTRISEMMLEALQEEKQNQGLPVFDVVIPRRVGVEDDAEEHKVAGDPGAHPDLSRAYLAFTDEVLAKVGGSRGRA